MFYTHHTTRKTFLLTLLLGLFFSATPYTATAQCEEKASSHVGDSNINPYEANESCFVGDEGSPLDLVQFVRKDNKELTFDFPVERYVGPVDGEGFLEDAEKYFGSGTLKKWLTLTFVAKFTLPDNMGPLGDGRVNIEAILNKDSSREISLGPLVGMYTFDFMYESQQLWQQFVIDIEADDLKYPDDPGCFGEDLCNDIVTRYNDITLKFTGSHPNECDVTPLCVKVVVDWISVGTEGDEALAWRPTLLLHGLGSTSATMQPGTAWADGLTERGLSSHAVSLTPNGSIQGNAAQITQHVQEMKDRFGVERVHIVGHSKGALDGRHYVQTHDDVENMIMLAAPNRGSPLAEPNAMILAAVASVAFNLGTIAHQQMSVQHMVAYNLGYRPNPDTKYITIAGDHDGNPANLLFPLGPNDNAVSVSSVESLSYADPWTYFSSDRTTDHSGLRYNTRAVTDLFDAYLSERMTPPNAPLFADRGAPLAAHRASKAMTTNQTAAAEGGLLEQGGLHAHTTAIADATDALFLVQWAEDDLDLEIVSPGGTRYDASTTATDVTFLSFSDEGWSQFEGFRVENPETGTWSFEVQGTTVTNPDGEAYSASVTVGGSTIALEGTTDQEAYHNNDPVVVTATLADNGTAITDATVDATVVHPDLTTITTLDLYDDGTNGDPTANDGQYTGTLSATSQSGLYNIALSAEKAATPAFTRKALAVAYIAESQSTFTGTATDAGIDSNGDGLYDLLGIDVGVNADVAGTYQFFATLANGSDIEQVRLEQDLTVGSQIVSFPFDGATLYGLAVDGPYTLKDVAMIEAGTGVPVDQLTTAHTTAAYSHTEFQHAPILLTGVTTDIGVDWYGDETFEELSIEVQADLLLGGDYHWIAQLFAQDGTFIAGAGNAGSLSPGLTTLGFTFSARDLVSTGRNGPYELKLLAMGGGNLTTTQVFSKQTEATPTSSLLVSDIIATTQAYDLADFGGTALPVELTTFDAITGAEGVTLRWTTLSESNNAGFTLQHRGYKDTGTPGRGDAETREDWEEVAFIEGAGTTSEAQTYAYRVEELAAGIHQFRLKQVDFDGTFTYSPEVEVLLELPETHLLTAAYPNPFNPQTRFTLAVDHAQQVRVEVFDAMGRRVQILYDGVLPAHETRSFAFDATGLPSGLYFYQAIGERFREARQVMLMK